MAANSAKNTVREKEHSKLVDLIIRMVREKLPSTFGGVIKISKCYCGGLTKSRNKIILIAIRKNNF